MTISKVLAPVRTLWLCAFTIVFLLGLDQFLFATKTWPPKFFYWAWCASAAILFHQSFRPSEFVRHPLVKWSFFYLLLSLLCFPWGADVAWAWDGLKLVFTTEIVVLVAVTAFPRVPDGNKWFVRTSI